MKSKRILSIILAVLLAFGSAFALTSCSKDEDGKTEKTTGTAKSEKEEKKDKEEPKTKNNRGKNKDKEDDKDIYSFDLSEIDDEALRDLAKKGLLKKHKNLPTQEEIEELTDMIINADYEDVDADEFLDKFGDVMMYITGGDEEYVRELIKEDYDSDMYYYTATEGDYIIAVDCDSYDEMTDGEYIESVILYNTKTREFYEIDEYLESGDVFELYSYEVIDGSLAACFMPVDADCSVAGGILMDRDDTYCILYDADGDLLGVATGNEDEYDYYDYELEPTDDEDFDELYDSIEDAFLN